MNFEWNPTKFSVLGVEFTNDLVNIADKNIERKLGEMQRDINSWSKRDLTPFGRVTVIKSLIISKIVHILISLPSPSEKMYKQLNKMLFEFLWDGKPDKIKRKDAKLPLENGGLGMIDIELFDKALKLTWIRRLLKGDAKWKTLILSLCPKLNEFTFYGNKLLFDMKKEFDNAFWSDVISYLIQFYSKFKITNIEEMKATSFQLNNHFKIGNSSINNNVLKACNIFFINQLMDNNSFLSHDQFINKYNNNVDFLTYHSIIRCIKTVSDYDNLEEADTKFKYQPPIDTILKHKKGASLIYKAFFDFTNDSKGREKWKGIVDITDDEWTASFIFLKNSTKDSKLRWIQFRVLHAILTTNRSVAKFKENQTDRCTFCNSQSETIFHLLWDCPIVKEFWLKLFQIISNRCKHAERIIVNEKLAIFGQSEYIFTDNTLDKIILLAKLYIYRCKVQSQTLNIKNFLGDIYKRYCIEKVTFNNSVTFKNKWEFYLDLFKSLL